MSAVPSVQVFGRKKNATAVAHIKKGKGLIRINGMPLELLRPEILRYKVYEPILLLGQQRFAGVDIRVRVVGGGYTSQVYAIRQAISKGLVAYYQKCKFPSFSSRPLMHSFYPIVSVSFRLRKQSHSFPSDGSNIPILRSTPVQNIVDGLLHHTKNTRQNASGSVKEPLATP